jgi:hypothetical protein
MQIISATLNRYYCFAHPDSILWIFWYVREASTAIIVTNVPHCYTLLRKILSLEAFSTLISSISRPKQTQTSKYATSTELNNLHHGNPGVRIDDGESTENVVPTEPLPLKIWQRSEYSIKDSDASEIQWGEAELQSILRGAIGTKSTIVGNIKGEQGKESDHV